MEVSLLEVREDGYQAYCVIFSPDEVDAIDRLRHKETMEKMIEDIIEVGMDEG